MRIVMISTCVFVLLATSRHARGQLSVSVSDFRYPKTRSLDWKAGLQGSFSSGRSETTSGVRSRVEGRASVVSNTVFFHTHERHDHTVSLSGYGTFDRRSEDAGADMTITNWNSSVSGSWSYLHAFNDADAFNFVGDGSGVFQFSSRSERELSAKRSESILDIRGTIGLGYGRMRDGTFVVRVLRIIERLQEVGVIIGEPTRDQLLPVVDRVAHTREYVTNFERYEKFLVADVVAQLVKERIVADSLLTPFSILKVAEAFRENIEPRLFGWRVAYSVGGWFAERRASETSTASYSTPYVDKMLIQRVSFDAGYPLSLWTHVKATGRLDLPVKETGTRYSLNLAVSVIHQLAERVALTGEYQFVRGKSSSIYDPMSATWRSTMHRAQLQFRFFVEDQIVITLSSVYTHDRNDYVGRLASVGPRTSSYRALDAWVGLTYDLF